MENENDDSQKTKQNEVGMHCIGQKDLQKGLDGLDKLISIVV